MGVRLCSCGRRGIGFTFATLALLVTIASLLCAVPQPAQASELAAGTQAQYEPRFIYVFPDGNVVDESLIYEGSKYYGAEWIAKFDKVVAGTITCDKSTLAITLDNVAFEIMGISKTPITLNLVGTNTLEKGIKGGNPDRPENLTIAGDGTLNVTNSSYGGIVIGGNDLGSSLTLAGGHVLISNTGSDGIIVDKGNFTMTGGSLTMKGGGITVTCARDQGPNQLGRASIIGGSVNIDGSIDAEGHMTNVASCLKRVSGLLSLGARFITGSNEYQLVAHAKNTSREYTYAKLVKYGSHSKKPSFGGSVKFGKVRYQLRGVATGAFSTPRGKQVRTLTFKKTLPFIDSRAFSGTKKLTRLSLQLPLDQEVKARKKVTRGRYRLVVVGYRFKWASGCKIAKNAFANCGKSRGKALEVKLLKYKGPLTSAKKALVKKGLNKKAHVVA